MFTPLRILFLEPQPCIRVLKYAYALRSALGKRILLCLGYTGYSLDQIYGYGDECFDQLVKLDTDALDQGIHDLTNDFEPMLIHSHNAPNTLTLSALTVADDVPIIHDVHEVLSVHNSGFEADDDAKVLSKYCAEERQANEQSNGRIYPTDGIRAYIQHHYDVDAENDLVFPNYVSESVMPRHFREKRSTRDGDVHIVYIGCITSVVEGSHYDLRKIFQAIASHKIHIHIYPTSNLITMSNDAYRRLAASNPYIHLHSHLDHQMLLEEITQYDFGWSGFNGSENKTHLDIALPNKVMEYVASGLPVLAFPHKTIQQFIETHGVGLVFSDIDELEAIVKNEDLSKIRKNALTSRQQFAIENQIPRVVRFYKKLLDTN
jgi:glycosyltransferase involved in cell wall biosynthesis